MLFCFLWRQSPRLAVICTQIAMKSSIAMPVFLRGDVAGVWWCFGGAGRHKKGRKSGLGTEVGRCLVGHGAVATLHGHARARSNQGRLKAQIYGGEV